MIAKLKTVRPFLVDENDDLYEFDVDVDVAGQILTVRHVSAQKLLDEREFAVVVAENLGYLMYEEVNWRRALSNAWQPPESKPEWPDEGTELADDDAEEMVLSDESTSPHVRTGRRSIVH